MLKETKTAQRAQTKERPFPRVYMYVSVDGGGDSPLHIPTHQWSQGQVWAPFQQSSISIANKERN